MIAGTLEIQMAANMARLADDMNKAKGIVGNATAQMESAVASLKSALGGLGLGLGVGYFVSLVKGSIDAAEHLGDLSKTTNLAVETLAGLRIAAKQSGGDLDSAAASINKLSVEVGKAPERFKALGVSATDPLEQFKQLADITNKLSDVNQRNAVLATALGKSWQGAAPLLAEGSKRIGEMVARGSEAAGVTAEMARQADELNDKWVLLVGTGGLMTRTVGPLLPLFNMLADNMLKATEKSKGLNDSFSPLLEILKVVIVVGANVSFTFETIGKDIARMFENIRLIAKGDFAGSRALGEVFRKDAEAARAALDQYTKTIMAIGTTPPGAPAAKVGAADAGDAAARAARFLGGDEAKDRADREQQIRDILHKVREQDDARELAQVELKNKQREEMDQQALQARFALIDAEEAAAIAHAAEQMAIDEQVAENKRRLQEEDAAATRSFLDNLASLMNTQSRKAFEVGKVASIANAIVKGYDAAVSSYAAGARIGGPYLGGVFAAASLLATANLINNIRSQSFGGGGGGGGSLGGTPVAPTQGGSNFTSQPPQASQTIFNVNITGVVTQSVIDQMIDQLKAEINEKDVVIIGQNSRQAADIAALA